MCVILLCLFFFIAFAALHIPSASAEVQDASIQQQTTGDTNNDTSRALPQYEHALVKDGCEYYPGFLNKIVKCSRDFLLGSLQISGNGQNDGLTFEKLRDPLRSIVASLLIVYVVIFTIKVGIGAVDNGLFKEVAISLLFITFVVYFAMEGDMYFWMRIFVFTQEGMASIVINQLNTDMGIISDGCFSQEDTWMRVDCTIYELIGYQEGKGFSAKTLGVAIVSGGLLLTPLGPIIAVTAMGMVALMILSFGQAAFNYIFAMMMVIILGFLSIIFIPCVLFEQTKDLFDFMLELLISFIITPAITLAYLTFMMIVLHYAVLCDDETCLRATYDKAREASKNYKPGDDPYVTGTTLVAAKEQSQAKPLPEAMVKHINDTEDEDLPDSLQAIKTDGNTTICNIYQAVDKLDEEEKSPIIDYLQEATNKKDVEAVETDIANLIKGCDNNSNSQHNKEFALASRVNTASTLPAQGVTCGHTDGIAVDTNLTTGADDGVKITIHPGGEAILPKYFDGISLRYNEKGRHILADANDTKSAYPRGGTEEQKNEWLQARISNVKASDGGGNKVFSYYTPLKSSSEASGDGERKTEETAVYVTSLGGLISPVSGGKGVMLSDRAKQTLITVSSDRGVKKGQQVATCISGVNSNSPGQSGNNFAKQEIALDKETQYGIVPKFLVTIILLGFLKASMENVNQLGGRLAGLPSISFPGQNIIFRKI
jgi:protein involved in ribonucleotide reduction